MFVHTFLRWFQVNVLTWAPEEEERMQRKVRYDQWWAWVNGTDTPAVGSGQSARTPDAATTAATAPGWVAALGGEG